MSAIGRGDWVECVDAAPRSAKRLDEYGPTLSVKALYQVTDAFVDGFGTSVILVGWERAAADAEHGQRCGYNVNRFRPVYRPRADLIATLLQPVDGVEPRVPA